MSKGPWKKKEITHKHTKQYQAYEMYINSTKSRKELAEYFNVTIGTFDAMISKERRLRNIKVNPVNNRR